MSAYNQVFGDLLKGAISSIAAYEHKLAPIVEEELGEQIGVAGKTVQRYKAGHLPPEARSIRILAEAAVQRGYLNRVWLQRFLAAALYPTPDQLIDQLCPPISVRPHPPRIYENLPAPTYSQFIMRAEAYAEMLDALQQRSAIVLIASLGGMGKTSLAREVAARCLEPNSDAPRFDAVVWVSDKDRPGTTNLSTVLDEIARTLDYPGFLQYEHAEKGHEVGQLLRRQRVLVVVDNFETVTDGDLLNWLKRLPEPSKVIVTSREKQRALWSSWLVELRGMTEIEAQALIDQRMRQLRIEKGMVDQDQLSLLVEATGGNPFAMDIALGCLKYEGRLLETVIDDLYSARGELFDRLFTRAWSLLNEATQQILLAMSLFPESAIGQALSATASIAGYEFDRAIERLTDLALLNIENFAGESRYTMHPLVRWFAHARLKERHGLETKMRNRWVKWYVQLVNKVEYCWHELERLDLLDREHATVYSVVEWALQHEHYSEALEIAKAASYYYYVRGIWNRRPSINLMGAQAARALDDPQEEARMIAYHVQLLSKQDNVSEADKYLPRLRELLPHAQFAGDVFLDVQHALALYWIACNDFDKSLRVADESLGQAIKHSQYKYILNFRQLYAICLYRKGQSEEAHSLFHELLSEANERGLRGSIVHNKLKLAAIELDRKHLDDAAELLAEVSAGARQYQYRWYIAETQRLYARLYTLRHNLPGARAALAEAIDVSERLGMRHFLSKARAELTELEAQE